MFMLVRIGFKYTLKFESWYNEKDVRRNE